MIRILTLALALVATPALAADKMTLIGFHLPGGGIGRAEATDDGYRFVGEGQ